MKKILLATILFSYLVLPKPVSTLCKRYNSPALLTFFKAEYPLGIKYGNTHYYCK